MGTGETGNRIVCGKWDKSDFLAKFHFYPSAVFLRRLLRRKEVGSGISLVVAGGSNERHGVGAPLSLSLLLEPPEASAANAGRTIMPICRHNEA